MAIPITRTASPRPRPDENNIPFGTFFSDHMFLMNYTAGKGWHDPRIVPYGPLSLEPSCMTLHYAQSVFEGMKAYRTAAGRVQLFRPTENIARMARSCE